jgi:epsilon-lactone hydrolase
MDTLLEHYRAMNAAAAMDPPPSPEERADLNERWGDVTAEPRGVDYLERTVGGVPAMWGVPAGCAEDRVLLSVHGGGYVSGSMYTHRRLYAHLAKRVGARMLIPGYRLTPAHRFPSQLNDVVATYTGLLDQGIDAAHIALVGDSAGGGMVVSAMLRARELGLPQAAALMPLSPWVDLTQSAGSLTTNRATDVLFGGDTPMSIEGLVALLLKPGDDVRDPLVSPRFADLTGLPPMYIQVSGAEMLLDDALGLEEAARKHGVEVRLDVFPGQQHTFQMSAGRSPVADDALARLAAWVRPKMGL